MLSQEFKPAITATKRLHTKASDLTATGIGNKCYWVGEVKQHKMGNEMHCASERERETAHKSVVS
jgi:hypothetical protein